MPHNWEVIRRRILRRDGYACQVKLPDGGLCGERATEVDHKRAGDDHSDSNLRAICTPCHKRKSAQEGSIAARAKRKEINQRFKRVENHPGAL